MTEPATADIVTVCYNGACPVCRREIDHYRRQARPGSGLRFLDVAAEPAEAALLGVGGDDAFRRLHAVTAGGPPVAGVEAFLATWRRLPRYRGLARLVGWAPLRPFAEALYERVLAPVLFAWHRRRVARANRGSAPIRPGR